MKGAQAGGHGTPIDCEISGKFPKKENFPE